MKFSISFADIAVILVPRALLTRGATRGSGMFLPLSSAEAYMKFLVREK
jgi:hypothetical protein